MKIAIAGASGFVGKALAPRLAGAGHTVLAMGRRRDALPDGDGITQASVDVGDRQALQGALAGCDAAYYLVHSMGGDDFAARDRTLARTFAEAARAAGVRRIVYLGGLGSGRLSKHLDSRQETGRILASTGVPTVELRAAVIIGPGSISFEMMRYLVERLPAMVTPRWVLTRIEPIAFGDVLAHLERALTVPAGIYEIGCGETMTYQDLMQRYARVRGLRPRFIVNVPVLTLKLSSYWVDFVTPVDQSVSHSLIESLANEVVAHDRERTRAEFGIEPMGLDATLTAALADQAADVAATLFERPEGLQDNVHTVSMQVPITATAAARADQDLRRIGGSLRWYGIAAAWRARIVFGSVFGERLQLHRPEKIEPGAHVDWWSVEGAGEGSLTLRSREWRFGDAWLGWRVEDGAMRQAAAFRPRGVPGFLYWQLLKPVHRAAFHAMLRGRVRSIRSRR